MTGENELLTAGRKIVQDMREKGAGLDGTDASIWFVQGALMFMANRGEGGYDQHTQDKLGYAVYLADLLATTCTDVRAVQVNSDDNGRTAAEIVAIQGKDQCRQFVQSWVWRCAANPSADNIVFKYAGALRDFGETKRAQALSDELAAYTRVTQG